MQNIEEQALATYKWTVPLWLRSVDDTFTTVHKNEIDDFHEHLTRQNADEQSTKEIEEKDKIPFVDWLVTHNKNKLRTTICKKPTHTDSLLDKSSYNLTFHKVTTIRTLTRRPQLLCDSPENLTEEVKYLDNFSTRTMTTGTLFDATLTETLNQMLRKLTRHLSILQPYLASKRLLKLSHGSYNPTTTALLTNLSYFTATTLEC